MNLLAQLRNPVLPENIGGGAKPSIDSGGTATGLFITNIIDAMFISAFILALIFFMTEPIRLRGAAPFIAIREVRFIAGPRV